MGVTRKIVYASTAKHGYSNTVYSNAETWGQLKREVPELESFALGMTTWIKTDKTEGSAFSSDHQALPPEDLTIYFLLEKNKSGIDEVVQAIDEWFAANQDKIKLSHDEPSQVSPPEWSFASNARRSSGTSF